MSMCWLDGREIPIVCWSGEAVDICYMDQRIERGIDRTLNHLISTGCCPEVSCDLNSQHCSRQLYHSDSHTILYVCICDYFHSYRDTITKHACTRHRVY